MEDDDYDDYQHLVDHIIVVIVVVLMMMGYG